MAMSFVWKHLYFFAVLILNITTAWGNFDGIAIIDNEDHFAVVKVDGDGKYEDFEHVDCSQQIFEEGFYDEGTACKNVLC